MPAVDRPTAPVNSGSFVYPLGTILSSQLGGARLSALALRIDLALWELREHYGTRLPWDRSAKRALCARVGCQVRSMASAIAELTAKGLVEPTSDGSIAILYREPTSLRRVSNYCRGNAMQEEISGPGALARIPSSLLDAYRDHPRVRGDLVVYAFVSATRNRFTGVSRWADKWISIATGLSADTVSEARTRLGRCGLVIAQRVNTRWTWRTEIPATRHESAPKTGSHTPSPQKPSLAPKRASRAVVSEKVQKCADTLVRLMGGCAVATARAVSELGASVTRIVQKAQHYLENAEWRVDAPTFVRRVYSRWRMATSQQQQVATAVKARGQRRGVADSTTAELALFVSRLAPGAQLTAYDLAVVREYSDRTGKVWVTGHGFVPDGDVEAFLEQQRIEAQKQVERQRAALEALNARYHREFEERIQAYERALRSEEAHPAVRGILADAIADWRDGPDQMVDSLQAAAVMDGIVLNASALDPRQREVLRRVAGGDTGGYRTTQVDLLLNWRVRVPTLKQRP